MHRTCGRWNNSPSDLNDLCAQDNAAVGLDGGAEALGERAEFLVLPAVVDGKTAPGSGCETDIPELQAHFAGTVAEVEHADGVIAVGKRLDK